MNERCQTIFSGVTLRLADRYANALAAGDATPGAYLAQRLAAEPGALDGTVILQRLLETKCPQMFAESAVAGDGRDWNAVDLEILGDISIAVDVRIYDDGRHARPALHEPPFDGTLVFTCGALLRNDFGLVSSDLARVCIDGEIDYERYHELYARRLGPVFSYIQQRASQRRRAALVTVPGLGCGQFAGRYAGTLGVLLNRSLQRVLQQHEGLGAVRAVVFDPYGECGDESRELEGVRYRVRPLRHSANPHPQLCRPVTYQEGDDDFSDCDLYSLVAWDPVSWPGNDFYCGARATDDGVKAAATSSMHAMTGVEGRYDEHLFQYRPPPEFRDWREVVELSGARLRLGTPFIR